MESKRPSVSNVAREAATRELERLGFDATEVLLLDLVPVVAVCWADGVVQPQEEDVLIEFTRECVRRVNRLAGYEAVTRAEGLRFLARLLAEPLDAHTVRRVVQLLPVVCLSTSEPRRNAERSLRIWGACVKAGAAAPDPNSSDPTVLFSRAEDAVLDLVDRALAATPLQLAS